MEKIMRELILFFSRLTKAKVVVVGMSGLEDGDVRTVCPDLCCGLTVVSPAEDVFARGELAGQDDGVHHRHHDAPVSRHAHSSCLYPSEEPGTEGISQEPRAPGSYHRT